jgi:hypothetical protein
VQKILDVIANQWIYDIETLSNGWVLYPVVPAILYSIFMIIKWMVLTIPLWLPLGLLIREIKGK